MSGAFGPDKGLVLYWKRRSAGVVAGACYTNDIVKPERENSERPDADKMTIRLAQPADLETIVEFNARLARESEGVNLDRDRLRAGVNGLLCAKGRGFYLLAEAAGSAIGQSGLTYEWSDWRNGTFWWLQSVYVLPEYRRLGVLSALYGRILELAEDENVCGVRLYVERNNVAAQAAYRRLGLAPTVFEMYERDFVIARNAPSR